MLKSAYLDKLNNADDNLAKAQEGYDKAVQDHDDATQTLIKEQDKLAQLLLNQRDATAQYNAVKAAYDQAQAKSQTDKSVASTQTVQPQSATPRVRPTTRPVVSPTPVAAPATPVNSAASPKVTMTRREYHQNLPQTNAEDNLLLVAMDALLAILGLSTTGQRRRRG